MDFGDQGESCFVIYDFNAYKNIAADYTMYGNSWPSKWYTEYRYISASQLWKSQQHRERDKARKQVTWMWQYVASPVNVH